MVKGLATVIYHVPDLDRAKLWYAAAFQQQPYFDQPFYVGFNVGGYELGLDPNPASGAGDPAAPSLTGAWRTSRPPWNASPPAERSSSHRSRKWAAESKWRTSPTPTEI